MSIVGCDSSSSYPRPNPEGRHSSRNGGAEWRTFLLSMSSDQIYALAYFVICLGFSVGIVLILFMPRSLAMTVASTFLLTSAFRAIRTADGLLSRRRKS